MIWTSEVIQQQREQQAKGPVRHGHLQVFAGGKVADGVFASRPTLFQRIKAVFSMRNKTESIKSI